MATWATSTTRTAPETAIPVTASADIAMPMVVLDWRGAQIALYDHGTRRTQIRYTNVDRRLVVVLWSGVE